MQRNFDGLFLLGATLVLAGVLALPLAILVAFSPADRELDRAAATAPLLRPPGAHSPLIDGDGRKVYLLSFVFLDLDGTERIASSLTRDPWRAEAVGNQESLIEFLPRAPAVARARGTRRAFTRIETLAWPAAAVYGGFLLIGIGAIGVWRQRRRAVHRNIAAVRRAAGEAG